MYEEFEEKNNETQFEQLKVRIACVLTGFHAAYMRYHVNCSVSLMCHRLISTKAGQVSISWWIQLLI